MGGDTTVAVCHCPKHFRYILSLQFYGQNQPAASHSPGIWGHLSVMTWRKHLVEARPRKTLTFCRVSSWEGRQTKPQAVSSTGWLGGERGEQRVFLRALSAMVPNGMLSLCDLPCSESYGFEWTGLMSLSK